MKIELKNSIEVLNILRELCNTHTRLSDDSLFTPIYTIESTSKTVTKFKIVDLVVTREIELTPDSDKYSHTAKYSLGILKFDPKSNKMEELPTLEIISKAKNNNAD